MGVSFLVCQHLPEGFESKLNKILGRVTRIPTRNLTGQTRLAPNRIYIAPSHSDIEFHGTSVTAFENYNAAKPSFSISAIFTAASKTWDEQCVGVVLSGVGSDGTSGLQSIIERGGKAIVESSDTAEFSGMPESGKANNQKAQILKPKEIATAIQTHFGAGNVTHSKPTKQNPFDEECRKIYRHLDDYFKVDFSEYRQKTLQNGIQQRMDRVRIFDISEYRKFLTVNSAETESLFHSFCIGLTSFFRDPKAFATLLEKAIFPTLKASKEEYPVRVWLPGCATGEEAFTVAILFCKACQDLNIKPNFKIFATDIHANSIQFASLGTYPKTALKELDSATVEYAFNPEGNGYRICPEIRSHVVFAEHNIITDPPFTRLDMVLCRNLLINFEKELQERILATIHFALKLNGHLFLGSGENPHSLEDSFTCIDLPARLFRRKEDTAIEHPHRTQHPKFEFKRTIDKATPVIFPKKGIGRQDLALSRSMEQLLENIYGESVLIDHDFTLVQSFGDCSRFLTTSKGRQTLNLRELIDPDLKSAVTSAVNKAKANTRAG